MNETKPMSVRARRQSSTAASLSNSVTNGMTGGFSLPPAYPGTLRKGNRRRASEGAASHHHGGEVKCETCGKSYKHTSCLHKHLWEHTPEWTVTSRLLISKHQQVQLLEAASILVNMNSPPSHDATHLGNIGSREGSAGSDEPPDVNMEEVFEDDGEGVFGQMEE